MNYWGRRGSGVLPFSQKTCRFMVSHRSPYVNEPNTFGVTGGKLEPFEDPKDAAIRELKEETGYDGDIELIPSYTFKDLKRDFEYQNYIGIVDEEFDSNPDPVHAWETSEVKWINFDELVNLDNKHYGLKKLVEEKESELENLCEIWGKKIAKKRS